MSIAALLRAAVVIGALVGALAVPGAADARVSRDRDGDGLRNRFERLRTHSNPRVADSDHDGLRDGRENPDHDGLNNRQEQASHTDPHDGDTDGDGNHDENDDSDCDGDRKSVV